MRLHNPRSSGPRLPGLAILAAALALAFAAGCSTSGRILGEARAAQKTGDAPRALALSLEALDCSPKSKTARKIL